MTQPHLQDIAKPATASLLDAIDKTMNSNTMLLKVQIDKQLTANNYQDELRNFLLSSLFDEMMIAVDQQRKWDHYTQWVPTANDSNDSMEMQHPTEKFVKDPFELIFTPMDEHQFAKRLYWMLREAFSPYRTHTTEQHAQQLIRDFFWEAFAPESWPLDEPSAYSYWNTHRWFFSAVKPDFLHSTGYYEDIDIDDIPPVAYFDGADSDTCTFFYEGNIFYLLFTNGSP